MGCAVLFHGPGQPLEIVTTRVPKPCGAEVLVRITACTLCRSDLHTHAGRRTEPTPLILGHEIVGRIEAFGPDAPRQDARGVTASVGSRITWALTVGCGNCFYCTADLPQKCTHLYKYGHHRAASSFPTGGGLADYILLVPGTTWFHLSDSLPDAIAAPANCATATAAAILRSAQSSLSPLPLEGEGRAGGYDRNSNAKAAPSTGLNGQLSDRSVLVLGAGILGVTACAMARVAGATVVLACDPDPRSRQRALMFGATATCSADPSEVQACVAAATNGRGVDVALELAGAASSVQLGLEVVRIGGTLVLAGTVAPTPAVSLDPEAVVRRLLTIRGVHNYHSRDLGTAIDFLARHGSNLPFASLIGGEYALDDVEQAFASAHAQPGLRVLVRGATA